MDSADFWHSFREATGLRDGIISITRIGFDSSRTHALVEARVDTVTPSWNMVAQMLLLDKSNGAWRIAIEDVGKGVTSGGWEGDRCVPVSPPNGLTRNAVESLDGDFIVTLEPDIGPRGTSKARMRFSRSPVVSSDGRVRPAPRVPGVFPLMFEVIDWKTGKPSGSLTLDFAVTGAGLTIGRRTDLMRVDGLYQGLTIRQVTDDGFFGSYESGVFGPNEFGHFCARRAPAG
jgi:hypothetical protein